MADFTALGDTVNTAARLTDLAAAGEMLINSEAVTAAGFETTGLERRTLDLRGTIRASMRGSQGARSQVTYVCSRAVTRWSGCRFCVPLAAIRIRSPLSGSCA
jgi:hypothetical protein